MKNFKRNPHLLAQAAMIGAIYVVLFYAFAAFGTDAIQVRIAEALTILPYFTIAAIPGVTIGCFLSNLIAGSLIDAIFGTLATLIAAIFTYQLRKYKFLAPVPPIVCNALIIPWVLRFGYAVALPIPYMMLTVGIGEVISVGIIGMILLFALDRYKEQLFKN